MAVVGEADELKLVALLLSRQSNFASRCTTNPTPLINLIHPLRHLVSLAGNIHQQTNRP